MLQQSQPNIVCKEDKNRKNCSKIIYWTEELGNCNKQFSSPFLFL